MISFSFPCLKQRVLFSPRDARSWLNLHFFCSIFKGFPKTKYRYDRTGLLIYNRSERLKEEKQKFLTRKKLVCHDFKINANTVVFFINILRHVAHITRCLVATASGIFGLPISTQTFSGTTRTPETADTNLGLDIGRCPRTINLTYKS